jgi:hypothetical protein
VRIVLLAFVLAAAGACGAWSGAESMAVFTEIAGKGVKVHKDVDLYLRRNNPDAAVVVMSRHIRDVDDTIDKVQRDATIKDRHKLVLLRELRGYRNGLAQSRNSLRAMSDVQDRWRRP